MEEGRVIGNAELLKIKFVGSVSGDDLTDQVRSALYAIQDKAASPIPGGMEHSIVIYYNTATGEIQYPESTRSFGEFSAIKTKLREIGDLAPQLVNGKWVSSEDIKRTILLHRPGDAPSTIQLDEAISNTPTGPDMGNRRVLPERITPEDPDQKGINEVWGESELTSSARGDLVMLRSIRRFNEMNGREH